MKLTAVIVKVAYFGEPKRSLKSRSYEHREARVFYKKVVLKNFAKLTRKHLRQRRFVTLNNKLDNSVTINRNVMLNNNLEKQKHYIPDRKKKLED